MNNTKWWKVWEVLYPVGIYFVVTNIAMFLMGTMWKTDNENYMIQQIIATAVTFPFIYNFYQKETEKKRTNVPNLLLMILAAGLLGMVLNNLIGYTNWKDTSQSYQELTDAFYGSTLLLEIAGTCILIPLLEELLYRGIVYKRLRGWVGFKGAVLGSALLFGVMHFNLIQFVYAGLIGVVLAVFMEWGGFKAAVLAHMFTNLVSILRSETGIFRFMDGNLSVSIMCTAVMSAVLLVILYYLMKNQNGTDSLR